MAPIPKMTKPICLIENVLGNRLRVSEDAKSILENISQPLVVVSIVGPYRSGKSYLINKLSGLPMGGHSVGHTVEANTKGIWMWCVPHPTKHDHTLVLLDTEGLGDPEKGDKTNDCVILSLAMLMSSVLVYNSKGAIDQDALEKLYSVTDLHDLIVHRSSCQERRLDGLEVPKHPSHMAPLFVWIIRDFTLKPKLGERTVTADEYLEDCLKDARAKTLKIKAQNEKRETIRRHFPKRKCFFFGFPSSDKQVMSTMDRVSEAQLEPGFVRETQDFCRFIFEGVPTKCLREDQTMTGSAFASLLKSYVDVVTTRDISCLERSMSEMLIKENEKTMQTSTEFYLNKMKDVQFNSEEEFQNFHEKLLKEALQELEKNYIRHEKSQTECLDRLKEDLLKKKEELWKHCEDSSRKKCKALLDQLMCDIDKALKEERYYKAGGYDIFVKDKNNVIKRYNQEPDKGVKAQEVLTEFLDSLKNIETIIQNTDQAISAKKPKRRKIDTKDCSQLTQYIQDYQLPTGRFNHILIQLFGFTGHGKSSFANSCLYVLGNGSFEDYAGEGSSQGGKTMDRRGYKLTNGITIVDNRGFAKLGSPESWEIYAQLCNFAPLNESVSWNKTPSERIRLITSTSMKDSKLHGVVVPVFIYSSEQGLRNEDFYNIKDFLKKAQELTGILPFIVLTKSRDESGLRTTFSRMGMERIYSVDNYINSEHIAVRSKHLEFLTILWDILDSVDFHLQECVDFQTQQQEWMRFLMEEINEMSRNAF